MAFRGRGRGRGFGGGGGFRIAKQEPFELFPEIENLPDAKALTEEVSLVVASSKLHKFWNSSPYCIVDGKTTNLSGFIKMSSDYVPGELAQGLNQERRSKKKVQWNAKSDLQNDIFEKLAKKYQGLDEKGGNEKKEDENEEEDEENLEAEEEEFSDDGDYNQNIDFDDDEDDFNMDDGGDDEPVY